MQGFPITLNLYADSAEEVEEARVALIEFINEHAEEGRAVTAAKVAKAARTWKDNVFIRNRIIEYFS